MDNASVGPAAAKGCECTPCQYEPASTHCHRGSNRSLCAVKAFIQHGESPVWVSTDQVAESNCVAVRRGGGQMEAKWRCAGKQTRLGRD